MLRLIIAETQIDKIRLLITIQTFILANEFHLIINGIYVSLITNKV